MQRVLMAALAALVVLCLAVPAGAQGLAGMGTCTLNGFPCWMQYPTAAMDGYAFTYSNTLKQGIWAAFPAATSELLSATHTDTTAATVTRGAIITGQGSTAKWALLTKGTAGQVLNMGANEPAWTSTLAVGITATAVTATGDLTAAQVNGGVISNYNMGAISTSTLPPAAAGYNCIFVVSTTGYAWSIKAGTGDKIYLDGTALDDGDKAALATPAVGNTLTCFTFQTGASAYDWICTSGGGSSWTDGGA